MQSLVGIANGGLIGPCSLDFRTGTKIGPETKDNSHGLKVREDSGFLLTRLLIFEEMSYSILTKTVLS